MIRFFKKQVFDYPGFWQDYVLSFKQKLPTDPDEVRFVVLDTETTGFDYGSDRILSIGAVSLQNKNIVLRESLELYIKQDHYNAESAKIHGILKNSRTVQISESEAIQQLLAFLKNSVIIAHHAIFDITMINRALERQGLPRLKNKVLDTSNLYKNTLITSNIFKKKEQYSLDELALKFDICKKDRHTALGDAYITAIAFLKILPKLRVKRPITLKKLIRLG